MEVRIGVQDAARELSIDTHREREDILKELRQAITDGGLFMLTDETDRSICIPAAKVAYLEFSGESGRKVGFGAGA